MFHRILVLTDNDYLLNEFTKLADRITARVDAVTFNYAFSYNNKALAEKFQDAEWIRSLNIRQESASIIENYDLVISLHCKQLFPAGLVNSVRCINVHPGLNPYNRGWFPQVFSILNHLPAGATIHEIDEELDHGPVICQKEVRIEDHDTSLSAYDKILAAELELLDTHLLSIVQDNYSTTTVAEGNINLKSDFNKLCALDLSNVDTLKNHIDLLRALSHGDYLNAYFLDENNKKVYLKIEIKPDAGQE